MLSSKGTHDAALLTFPGILVLASLTLRRRVYVVIAAAIVLMPALVGILEIKKVIDEIDEKKKLIEELQSIIDHPEKLDGVVKDEFKYMKKQYGDERKTDISQDLSVYNIS